jgi:hypothetical protein
MRCCRCLSPCALAHARGQRDAARRRFQSGCRRHLCTGRAAGDVLYLPALRRPGHRGAIGGVLRLCVVPLPVTLPPEWPAPTRPRVRLPLGMAVEGQLLPCQAGCTVGSSAPIPAILGTAIGRLRSTIAAIPRRGLTSVVHRPLADIPAEVLAELSSFTTPAGGPRSGPQRAPDRSSVG